MRWRPFALPFAILLVVLAGALYLVSCQDDEKRRRCADVGGVVLPDSRGWRCALPGEGRR
jgi:hypothetical protein